MKHLYIILLVFPLIGLGQGLNFKLGSTVLIPFNNYEENSFDPEFGSDTNTKLGFQSSVCYDFIFKNISDKFSVSPSFSYSLINFNYYEEVGPLTFDETWKNHHLQFSLISGYRVNDLITTKLGISLDSKISSSVKGTNIFNPTFSSLENDLNDPYISLYSEGYLEGVHNEFELLGFSGHFSLEFGINKVVSVFSNFQFSVLNFGGLNPLSTSEENLNYRQQQVPRRYLTLGLGFNI